MSAQRTSETESRPLSRWPGVLLSMLIMGFGLVRAGRWGRGLAWFFGLQLYLLLSLTALSTELVPMWVGWGLAGFAPVLMILGWADSFRPGRMTPVKWLALALGLGLTLGLSTPLSWAFFSQKIATPAMSPTLIPGDHVLVDKLTYRFTPPQRGHLVVFDARQTKAKLPEGEEAPVLIAFRIAGLPGETVVLEHSSLYINGVKVGAGEGIPPVSYIHDPLAKEPAEASRTWTLGADEYFVLGDNSRSCYDSRFWGAVPSKAIVGRITQIYYPFARLGRPEFRAQ